MRKYANSGLRNWTKRVLLYGFIGLYACWTLISILFYVFGLTEAEKI